MFNNTSIQQFCPSFKPKIVIETHIGEKGLKYVESCTFAGFPKLRLIEIKEYNLTKAGNLYSAPNPRDGVFRAEDCPELDTLVIEDNSLGAYFEFILKNLLELRNMGMEPMILPYIDEFVLRGMLCDEL